MLVRLDDRYSVDIRHTDPTRHKYGSAIAEYIDTARDCDTWSGDVDAPCGWFGLMGKRTVRYDDRGFVDVETWADAASARRVYDALDRYYDAWFDEDEDAGDDAARIERVERESERCTAIIEQESALMEHKRGLATGQTYAARCGRTDVHHGHAIRVDGMYAGFCAGNRRPRLVNIPR